MLAATKAPPKSKEQREKEAIEAAKTPEQKKEEEKEKKAAADKAEAEMSEAQKDEKAEEDRKKKEEKEYQVETDPYKANRSRECLLFRIEGTGGDFTIWGFDYVRHLAGEIIYAYNALTAGLDSDDEMEVEGDDEPKEPEYLPPKETLFSLADAIIKFQLNNNEQIQAIDLMFELERTHDLVALCPADACERISLYLVSMVSYQATVEEKN